MSDKLASIIDVDSVSRVIQRRCHDMGVTVEWDPRATTAQSNGRKITLPTLKQPITQEQLDLLYGYVIHESGHNLRQEAFDIARAAKPPAHVMSLYNISEDDALERERAHEWRGDGIAISHMNEILMGQAIEKWGKAIKENPNAAEDQDPNPMAAVSIQRLAAMDWDPDSGPIAERLINVLPENIKQLVTELASEGWVDRLRACVTPKDTWNFTIDLTKRLYPEDDEDQMEQMRQDGLNCAGGQEGEGEQGKGEGESPESGEEQAKGPSRDTSKDPEHGEGSTEEGKTDNGEGQIVSWQDIIMSDHEDDFDSEDRGKGGSIGIDWTGYNDPKGVQLMPTNLVNVIDLEARAKQPDRGSYYSRGAPARAPRAWTEFMPTEKASRSFAARIRRYIQAQARSTIDKEKYHGKIDRSSLVRLALPPIDGGEYNKRIFYDQRKHTMKDTAIFVLVDWSGSMSGTKMHYASDAAQRLIHTFDRVLNVPVGLAAFSNRQSACDVGYIKKFNKRGVPAEEIARRFSDFNRWTSGNNDADSLHWAWRELMKRKESRKILIVLSDGCPAGSWNSGSSSGDNLKHVTNFIQKDKRVELYGVGIRSDAVETYYKNCKVLDDPKDINTTLFNIIREGDKAVR